MFFLKWFTRKPVEILDDHCDFRVRRRNLHGRQQPEVEDRKKRGPVLQKSCTAVDQIFPGKVKKN